MCFIHDIDVMKLFGSLEVYPVTYNLKVVAGENVSIQGEIDVNVLYKNKYYYKSLVVLKCNRKLNHN